VANSASNSATFNSDGNTLIAAGTIIKVVDAGVATGWTEFFTASNANDVAGAAANSTTHKFNVTGLTATQARDSFVAEFNLVTATWGNANFNMTSAASVDPIVANITNSDASQLSNNSTASLSAGSGIVFTAFSGGANKAAAGDSVTISDGTQAVKFTAVANGTIGANPDNVAGKTFFFELGPAGANQVATTLDSGAVGLRQAIIRANGAGPGGVSFNVTSAAVAGATDATKFLALTNGTAGKAGNSLITLSNAQAFSSPSVGMVDGADAFAANESITISDGGLLNAAGVADQLVTFTATANGTAPVNNAATRQYQFEIGANAALTMNNPGTGLEAAIAQAEADNNLFVTVLGDAGFNGTGETVNLKINANGDLVKPAGAIGANALNAGLMQAANGFAFTPDVNVTNQWATLIAQTFAATPTGGLQAFAGGTNSQSVTKGDTITVSTDGTLANTKVFEAVDPGGVVVTAGDIAFNDTWSGSTSVAQSFASAVNTAFATFIGAAIDPTVLTGKTVILSALATGPGGLVAPTTSDAVKIGIGALNAGTLSTPTTTYNYSAFGSLVAGDTLIIGNTVFLASNVNNGTVFAIDPASTINTATNLATAISGSALNVTAVVSTGLPVIAGNTTDTLTTVTITAKTPGAAGNTTGSGTAGSPFQGFNGLSGGQDGGNVVAGDTVTINDGTTSHTLTAITTGPAAAGQFVIGNTPAATAASLAAAINLAFGTTIVASDAGPNVGGTGEIITVANNVTGGAGTLGNQAINVSGSNLSETDMTGGVKGSLSTSGDFVVTVMGDWDNNVIDLFNLTVGRNLLINANTGGGAEDGSMGNQVTLDAVTVTGQTKVTTGSGVDVVAIDDGSASVASLFKGIVVVNLGKSADTLLVDQAGLATTFLKSATFNTGGGADILQDAAQVVYTKASGNTFAYKGVAGQHALLNSLGTSLVTASATVVKPTASNVNG
jgi:hypothetical protein